MTAEPAAEGSEVAASNVSRLPATQASAGDEPSDAHPDATVTESDAARPQPPQAQSRPEPAHSVVGQDRSHKTPLPDLSIDPADPTAMVVAATVLSIPGSLMRRFEHQRPQAPSHTVLMLDAVRAHAADLPDLVERARPTSRPGDLFPARPPGTAATVIRDDRPLPLRVRPTVGELSVVDRLVDWVTAELRRRRPGSPKANRSEVVAAALDKYLPQLPKAQGRRRG